MSMLEELRTKFEPDKWKKCLSAGCYPYAIDFKDDSFRLVGAYIGHKCKETVSDEELLNTLERELKSFGYSMRRVSVMYMPEKDELMIALQRGIHGFYHFLRKDENGIWSHKYPGSLPKNRFENGMQILDPEPLDDSVHFWCWALKKK